MHLFGNMLFLWIYGDNVEHRLGRVRFLSWYLATGVAATLAFALFASDSMVPLVGASGAISGVLGFYFLWFPRNTVRVFVLPLPVLHERRLDSGANRARGLSRTRQPAAVPAVGRSGRRGIAHGAHIGGFVAGLGAAWGLTRREVTVQPAGFRRADVVDAAVPGGATASALERGDMVEAARSYFALSPDDTRPLCRPEDLIRLGEWLAANRHAEAALVVFRRHLRDYPAGAAAARAHLGAGLVQLTQLGQAAPAYQHFLDALDLEPDADTAKRPPAALAEIAAHQKYNIGRPRT